MASGDTLCIFGPFSNYEPPATNYASIEFRNGHPVLAFDQTTQEIAIFSGVMPRHYGGGGITVYVTFCAVPTSGTMGFDSAFERIGDGALDIDGDSFATAKTITAVTVPGTSGLTDIVNVAHSSSEIASVAAGEFFRYRLRRDVANDNAAGDGQVLSIELKET